MEVLLIVIGSFVLGYIIDLNLKLSKARKDIYKIQLKTKKHNDDVASLCIMMLVSYRPLYTHLETNSPHVLTAINNRIPYKLTKPSKFFKDIKKIKDIYGKQDKK